MVCLFHLKCYLKCDVSLAPSPKLIYLITLNGTVGVRWLTEQLRVELESNCLAKRCAFLKDVNPISVSEIRGRKVNSPKFLLAAIRSRKDYISDTVVKSIFGC